LLEERAETNSAFDVPERGTRLGLKTLRGYTLPHRWCPSPIQGEGPEGHYAFTSTGWTHINAAIYENGSRSGNSGPEEQPKNSGIIGTQYLAERGVLLAEAVEIEEPPSAEKIIDRLRFHSDEAVSLAADSESIYLVSLPERGGKDQAMGRAASANPF
jgi:hypothetical protein